MVTTGYTDCSYVKLQQSVKMTFFLQVVFTPVFNTFLNTWRVGKYNCKWPVEYFLSLLPCSDCWHTHCFSLVFSFEYNRILPFFGATPFSYYEIFFSVHRGLVTYINNRNFPAKFTVDEYLFRLRTHTLLTIIRHITNVTPLRENKEMICHIL